MTNPIKKLLAVDMDSWRGLLATILISAVVLLLISILCVIYALFFSINTTLGWACVAVLFVLMYKHATADVVKGEE